MVEHQERQVTEIYKVYFKSYHLFKYISCNNLLVTLNYYIATEGAEIL